jgi:hypothetical protein
MSAMASLLSDRTPSRVPFLRISAWSVNVGDRGQSRVKNCVKKPAKHRSGVDLAG